VTYGLCFNKLSQLVLSCDQNIPVATILVCKLLRALGTLGVPKNVLINMADFSKHLSCQTRVPLAVFLVQTLLSHLKLPGTQRKGPWETSKVETLHHSRSQRLLRNHCQRFGPHSAYGTGCREGEIKTSRDRSRAARCA